MGELNGLKGVVFAFNRIFGLNWFSLVFSKQYVFLFSSRRVSTDKEHLPAKNARFGNARDKKEWEDFYFWAGG
jgi:hypothetical protein